MIRKMMEVRERRGSVSPRQIRIIQIQNKDAHNTINVGQDASSQFECSQDKDNINAGREDFEVPEVRLANLSGLSGTI